MNRERALPRVTYSNIRADFSGVHAELDRRIGEFERAQLGHLRANRIDGRDDTRGESYAMGSPIDADLLLGSYIAADAAAVDAAVAAAAAAFRAWSRESAAMRATILRAVATEIERCKWDLAIAALFDVGKSRMEALGEAEEAIDLIRYYAAELEAHAGWEARPMQRAFAQEVTSERLRPYGVFGVIAPFNYPIALAVGMLTGVIITGNTAVFKPSPGTGLTARLLIEAFDAGGVPPGVVNLVCGGAETGRLLVGHPGVAGFAFTGSHETGMAILRHCASGAWHRPVIVEMGGKNPAYVTASADLDVAAEGVTRSAFSLSGQKCSSLSRLFVHADVHDALLDRIRARARALAIGDPRQAGVFTGPVITPRAGQRFLDAAADVRAAGATIACGGGRLSGGLHDRGAYVEPTIVVDLAPDHRVSREELFVPLLAVHRFGDLAAALAEGNAVPYGLTAGIYAWEQGELDLFLDRAEAGVLYANRASGATTGAWPGIQSFCGWKGSGASGKGGLGPHYLTQFMREQSRTIMTE
jgi:1-pyrroline-5-carboxylate dehydrogenase